MGPCFIFLIMTVLLSMFTPLNDGEKHIYKTEQIIQEQGYTCETHHVMTTDGYLLGIHRIPFKRYSNIAAKKRPVVLLMHGMFGASNSFLHLGPKSSLAYNLADAGFDVWMGNSRGTKNARFHTYLDPDDKVDKRGFFDFTYEEIGLVDLAETVDFILAMTEEERLHFIGMGAGGTAFLVLNSMMPSYNEKFCSANLLAGVGYQKYFDNKLLISLATFTNTYYRLFHTVGVVELFPPDAADKATSMLDLPRYCTGDDIYGDVCELMGIAEIMGPQLLQALEDTETAGASVKQVAHYGQNIKSKKFSRWDFGEEENLEVYDSEVPPEYDLSKVTVNTTLHYSAADHLVAEYDVLMMARVMPRAVARKVPKVNFNHFDFILSPDVKALVNDYITKNILDNSEISLRDVYPVPWSGQFSHFQDVVTVNPWYANVIFNNNKKKLIQF